MSDSGKPGLPPTDPATNSSYGGQANAAFEPVSQTQGAAGGSQHPYEEPPSYQQYPGQQGYPPQGVYSQPGGSHPGGYQAGNIGYGATVTTEYPITSQPQHTDTTPIIMTTSKRQSLQHLPVKENSWDQGLCGCCNSCELCLLSWCCPCYIFGKNAEALGHSCCLCGVGAIIPHVRCVGQIMLRTEIRNLRGIKGSQCRDFCSVCFCSVCALTQEANEVRVMASEEVQRV